MRELEQESSLQVASVTLASLVALDFKKPDEGIIHSESHRFLKVSCLLTTIVHPDINVSGVVGDHVVLPNQISCILW